MAARIEPTTEQLHAAWLQRRKRSWPPTLEATLADPLYAALVRMAAVRSVLADRQAAQPKPAPRLVQRPATPAHTAWPPRRPAATQVDRKRAAAGDRDD